MTGVDQPAYPRCLYCGSGVFEHIAGCGAPWLLTAAPACPMCGGRLQSPWNLGDPWHCTNCGADVRGPLPLTTDLAEVVVKS